MSQIKKAQDGTRLTTLQQENEELLLSPDISQELKDKAMAIINFSQEVIKKEQFQPRDLTLYQAGIAQSVNNLLKGKKYYNPTQTGYADTNIFGYYNKKRELPFLVNETVKMIENSNPTEVTIEDPGVQVKTRIIPDLVSGFDTYVTDTVTNDDRAKRFATWLGNKLGKISYTDNDIVQGISEEALPNLTEYANTLKNIGQQGLIDKNNLNTIGKIVSTINNPELTKLFENWFQVEDGYIFGKPEDPIMKQVTIGNETFPLLNYNNDPQIGKYLLDKGYTTIKDQNRNYVLLNSTKTPVPNLEDIELDPTSAYYKHALVTDNQGRVLFGSLEDPEFQKQIGTKLESIKNKIIQWNKTHYPILDYSTTGDTAIVDMSRYFNTDNLVTFTPSNFDYNQDLWFPYEQIPGWEDLQQYFSFTPNSTRKTYEQVMGYNPIEQSLVPEDYTDNAIVTQFGGKTDNYGDINSSRGGRDYTYNYLLFGNMGKYSGNAETFTNKLIDFVKLYTLADLVTNDPNVDEAIKKQYQDKVDENFQYGKNKTSNGNELMVEAYTQLKNQKPEYFKYLLYKAILATKDPKDKARLVNFYNDNVRIMKEGGVLKMFQGGGTKLNPTPSNNSNQEEQHDTPIKESGLSDDQKRALGLMAVSLANDIALMFDPHPIASGLQSAAGLGMDIATDYYSGIPTRNIVGNAATNLGFGLLSTIPAIGNYTSSIKVQKAIAKAGKFLKGLGGIGALASLGFSFPEYTSTLDKVINGDVDKFSVQDYRNLQVILSAIISGGTAGVKNIKHRPLVKESGNTFIPVTVGGKKTHVKVSADELAEIKKAQSEQKWYDFLNLRKKKENREAYQKKLKEIKADQNIDEVIFNNPFISKPSRLNTRSDVELDKDAVSTLLSRKAANKYYYRGAINPNTLPEYTPSAPLFKFKNLFAPKGPKVTTQFDFEGPSGKKASIVVIPNSERKFLEGSVSQKFPDDYNLIDPGNRVTNQQLELLNKEILYSPKYKKYFIVEDKLGGKLEKLNKYIENGRTI